MTTNQITEIKHPVISHKLGYLRDKSTDSQMFRRIVSELTQFLAYEATRDIELESIDIQTPMSQTKVERVSNRPIIVSIMRAGNGMLESMLNALPFCSVGHIGIYRDKFIDNTVEYYFKLPEEVKDKEILLVDPLLATGDTAVASIDRLKKYEVGHIKLITILTCKAGTDRVHHFHPDVEIITLSANEELNEKGYLVPGLGDAGDRLFGTK